MQNQRDERVGEVAAVWAVDRWVEVDTVGQADAVDAVAQDRSADVGTADEPAAAQQAPVVLDEEEAELLARILTSYLGDLRMEIVDTDNPAMRRDLHHEEDAVRALLARLPAP